MKRLKILTILSVFMISGLFSMNAFAGSYPISHATFNSTGSIVYDMSGDIKFYLSDLKNSQTDFNYLSDYVTAQKTTLESAISTKQTEVTNGKNTIVNKMANSCSVPAANVDTNNNSIYEWSEITTGVDLVYKKGLEKGSGVVSDAINSKGIYQDVDSGSSNVDHEISWTNNKGCKCYVEFSCECGSKNLYASAAAYNASGTLIYYECDDEDGDMWTHDRSKAEAAISAGGDHAPATLWTDSVSGGTIYQYYSGGKHGGNHYQSAGGKCFVPAGGKVVLYMEGVHGSGSDDASDWSIVAIPLGFN